MLGHNVMEDWETNYMTRSVDFLLDACPERPIRVLEAGWGQGISGRCFLRNESVDYEVIELHPSVAENARRVFSEMSIEAKVHEGAMERISPNLEVRTYDVIYSDIYTATLLAETSDAIRDKNAFVAHYASQLQPTPRTHDFYAERLNRGVRQRILDGPEVYTKVLDFVYISLIYSLLKVGGVVGFYSAREYIEEDPLKVNYRRTLFPEQRTLRVEGNQPTPASYYDAGTHMYAYCFRKS